MRKSPLGERKASTGLVVEEQERERAEGTGEGAYVGRREALEASGKSVEDVRGRFLSIEPAAGNGDGMVAAVSASSPQCGETSPAKRSSDMTEYAWDDGLTAEWADVDGTAGGGDGAAGLRRLKIGSTLGRSFSDSA